MHCKVVIKLYDLWSFKRCWFGFCSVAVFPLTRWNCVSPPDNEKRNQNRMKEPIDIRPQKLDKFCISTLLELNTSQEAPMHCPTLDSLTQCFASAHFRSPPVRLQFASSSPPISLRLQFRLPPYSITDFSPNWNGFLSKLEAQRNWRGCEIGGALEAHWRRTGGALEAT